MFCYVALERAVFIRSISWLLGSGDGDWKSSIFFKSALAYVEIQSAFNALDVETGVGDLLLPNSLEVEATSLPCLLWYGWSNLAVVIKLCSDWLTFSGIALRLLLCSRDMLFPGSFSIFCNLSNYILYCFFSSTFCLDLSTSMSYSKLFTIVWYTAGRSPFSYTNYWATKCKSSF